MQISQDVIDRFMSKVNTNAANGCWEWTKGKWSVGYGVMRVHGIGVYAHRLSYMIYKGDIPKGMHVCHSCDNPGCVNPAHLWLGTPSENALDREHKGRRQGPKGSENYMALLNESEVSDIRERSASKENGIQARLAAEYGVARSTISSIVCRRSWKHLR